jgi:hypothetical protein
MWKKKEGRTRKEEDDELNEDVYDVGSVGVS